MSKLSKQSRNKRTEAAKRRLAEQPGRTIINRKRKLTKHVKKNPQDQQAKQALASSQ